ncbi:MAG: 30S ribosomal protein S2 [Patescibacteria group bacterium]
MTQIPELVDLLKSGAHFGHQISKWHPKMAEYIFTSRSSIHLINLEITQKKLAEAADFARQLGREGKVLLFIGTKKQTQEIIKKYASECGAPYVSNKWLGGTFTNFAEISKLIRRYIDLRDRSARGLLSKYTKKEQVDFAKEIEKTEHAIGGITVLTKLPDAVYIVDIKHEKTALVESHRVRLPIIAICDTNVDPSLVDYIIPANDDAVKSVEMITAVIAGAYQEGKAEAKVQAAKPKEEVKEEVKMEAVVSSV